MRNSVSIGDGIYRSDDGGENWTNLGLKNSEHIVKILVDPTETNTVYVCVPGKLWSDSDERGVYKTTDGGKTWTKVLKGANLSTGCSMMSMDPLHPKTLYAGMWDFRRRGWTFRSGGDSAMASSGSGLFKKHRWRHDVERAGGRRGGPPTQAVGSRGGDGCAVEAGGRVRVHRKRCRRSTRCTGPMTPARRGRCSTAART